MYVCGVVWQGPATAVAFSRAGDFFASGGSDEQVSSSAAATAVATYIQIYIAPKIVRMTVWDSGHYQCLVATFSFIAAFSTQNNSYTLCLKSNFLLFLVQCNVVC